MKTRLLNAGRLPAALLARLDEVYAVTTLAEQADPAAHLAAHGAAYVALATLPHVQSGKPKVLGVSKATRVPLLANVPTIAEQGVKGFESGTWQGLLVPANTPPAVVAKLNAELIRIIRSPEVRERLVSQGAEVSTMTPTEFSAFFERERKQWATVVAQGGVRID